MVAAASLTVFFFFTRRLIGQYDNIPASSFRVCFTFICMTNKVESRSLELSRDKHKFESSVVQESAVREHTGNSTQLEQVVKENDF